MTKAAIPVTGAREQGARLRRLVTMLACATLLAWMSGWMSGPARAAEEAETLEQRVKAAYLYKFAGYVEWPSTSFPRPDFPVTIGVMGNDALAAELVQAVTGRTVSDRTVVVKRLRPGDSLAGIQVLFVGRAESARLSQVAQSARPRSILIVTDSEGALAQGGMINFVVADRRVRFEISLDAAEKSGLKLSSRLLAVAQQVRTGTN